MRGGPGVLHGRHGLNEVGAFIDEGSNNFWGVEDMDIRGGHDRRGHGKHGDSGKGRYFALSDRDYCLYILRYTG